MSRARGLSRLKLRLEYWLGSSGSLRRQLVTSMTGTFTLNLASKLLMLGASVVLARLMGANGYGVYASAMAIMMLVTVPASLGLPNLIVRLVSAYRVDDEWSLMKGLLVRSTQLALVVTGIIALLLLVLCDHFHIFAHYSSALVWVTFVLLPLTLLSQMWMTGLRGLHHVVLGLIPETLIMPLAFIVGVLLLHWLTGASQVPLLPIETMAVRVMAAGLAFLAAFGLLLAHLPPELRTVPIRYHTPLWLKSAGPLMWVTGMGIVTTQTDVVMLSAMKGASAAGIYQVAARGAALTALVSTIGNIALQPTISRLYTSKELNRLKRVATLTTRVMFAAALTATLVFFAFGSQLLTLIFGPPFANGKTSLVILSVGWTLVAATGPVRDMLIMTGREQSAAIAISFGAASNVILNAILIPSFGITGAALATAFSLIVFHLGCAYFIRYHLGYWIRLF